MAKFERIYEPNSNGEYSEIHYFDNAGESVDETKATRCVIREYTSDGELIGETWGTCNNQ